jgi:hypothetical protein
MRREAGKRRCAGRPRDGNILDVSRGEEEATARCGTRNERLIYIWRGQFACVENRFQ